MIIDSHVHFGTTNKFNMPSEILLESMKKYNIDYSIVSNVEACEFSSELIPIPKSTPCLQLSANEKTLNLVKNHAYKLKGLFWICPNSESFDDNIGNFILENSKHFVGIKMHPFHSNIAISDLKCEEYLKFAQKHKIPFVVHTAADEKSHVRHVYLMAKKYPDIDFVMVHMGLGTNNLEAIEYISQLDNLYGDTTWVSLENTLMAIKKCGSEKILFGTDSPIDGINTYDKYLELMEGLKKKLPKKDYENVMFRNAIKLFKLNL
ncbi:putative metal-dependent hydrolase of the TIM-barrel fold protein [Clostridium sp. N3C]|uniref:amidohydrolase family protein n=1 Tax=Clostridium sp. N3C TaxID=1776758 RepID=UPI00092E155F|nr:amidohydrolase family protein [Clostridium sp. N3C]SCN25967.1 putative metal-dependent hydrolase of the TIM-barrel fold protein [Clostridium sp. N3C]